MKRLALVLAAATLLLPSAASAAACSPLNCAPSQFSVGDSSLLGFRTQARAPVTIADLETGETRWTLPWGFTGGNLLVHQNAYALNWWDATTGSMAASAKLARGGTLVGVSQNGKRAVVRRIRNTWTEFRVVSPGVPERAVRVPRGNWDFDALLGDNLFLIKYVANGGYQVRLAHIGSGRLETAPLKDPHESGTIWGQPFERLASADGRYLFTLYIGQNGGSMVHELDLKTATARCIDLPGTGNYGAATSWAMLLSKDERTLWTISPGYGRAVGIDVASRTVSSAFQLTLANWNLGFGTRAALAPDGAHVALADGRTVAVVGLVERKVVERNPKRATAVGYSPDGTLWTFS
jgi:hypothetical protein